MSKKNRTISDGGNVTGEQPVEQTDGQAGEQFEPASFSVGKQPIQIAALVADKLAAEIAEAKESKAAKFKRLAERRVSNALRHIGYVRNLANRNQYEYTEEQAQQVKDALADAVSDLCDAFAGTKPRSTGFTFGD